MLIHAISRTIAHDDRARPNAECVSARWVAGNAKQCSRDAAIGTLTAPT